MTQLILVHLHGSLTVPRNGRVPTLRPPRPENPATPSPPLRHGPSKVGLQVLGRFTNGHTGLFHGFCPEQIHSKHWRPGLLGHMGVFSIGSFPFLASVWVDWWVDWSWNQRLRLGSTPGHTQRTVGPKPRPPRSIKSRNVWATAPGGGGTLGGKMD